MASSYDLAQTICSRSSLSTEVSKAVGRALSWPHEKRDSVCCGYRGTRSRALRWILFPNARCYTLCSEVRNTKEDEVVCSIMLKKGRHSK